MEKNPLGCISNISLIAGKETVVQMGLHDSVTNMGYPQYHNRPHQTVQSLTWLTLKGSVCQHKQTVNCLCKSHHGSTVTLIPVCLTDVHENPSCQAESNKDMRVREGAEAVQIISLGFLKPSMFPNYYFLNQQWPITSTCVENLNIFHEEN